jgi:pimeloyl-ACP methyl ester carboxylesterase
MSTETDDGPGGSRAADGEALGPELFAERAGVRLCYQALGDPAWPTVLLVEGLGASMDWWPADLCVALSEGGRRVVRYDHHDTGRSTTGVAGEPAYTARDLLEDPLVILDDLGVDRAHLVGLSMGGGIAQELAVEHPRRVASLTLMSTSPALDRRDDTPLPGPAPELSGLWDGSATAPGEGAATEASVREDRLLTGGGHFDEVRTRAIARRAARRSADPAAAANHAAVVSGSPVRGALSEIRVPTLVVHGDRDPLFPGHGPRLAAEIPGARLLVLHRTGHQVPPPQTWDLLLPALLEHTV